MATVCTNLYRDAAELFVGGDVLLSLEGTTQGDPLAMAIYGLAVLPLIRKIAKEIKQVWFADDATGGGKLTQVKGWWDRLNKHGPAYGYFPNASKTWLLVKEESLQPARKMFEASGVQITSDGRRLLGSPIGTEAFCAEYLKKQVSSWESQLVTLSSIARTQPHAAYSALTHALTGRWTFLARTSPGLGQYLQPLEDMLRSRLIPALTGHPSPGNDIRALLALPPRLGGLGIINPVAALSKEFERSTTICAPLTNQIVLQSQTLGVICADVKRIRSSLSVQRRKATVDAANQLKPLLPLPLQRAMEIYSDQGASHWLCALPIMSHGFALPKGAFRDALCLRYNWQPDHLPVQCACGQSFSVDHALSCPTGGYSVIRHNELRDLTASLLSEVCHDVETEPQLLPLTGEQLNGASANTAPEARLDVSARGFWGDRFTRSLFDVRVFHPNAPSAQTTPLASQYKKHERSKRRQYEQRVREIEGASFVPLVFSTSGGMGPACSTTFKRLANLLGQKLDLPYSGMVNWLRCRLSFALLRSAIMALRGSRRHVSGDRNHPALAMAESFLPLHN